MQLCSSLSILLHCLCLELEWKLNFSSPVATAGFSICWHIECSTFTASSFRIWNSSTGTPSPPLALFVVMLSKAHLTSHSKMSGSRLVITSSWLSGSWRSFLYSSSVHSCHQSLGISNFLEEISSFSHSIGFLYFFALITEEVFLSLLAILWHSVLKWVYLSFSPLPFASLLFWAVCKASSDNHFAFLHFFFLGMVLMGGLLYNVTNFHP